MKKLFIAEIKRPGFSVRYVDKCGSFSDPHWDRAFENEDSAKAAADRELESWANPDECSVTISSIEESEE